MSDHDHHHDDLAEPETFDPRATRARIAHRIGKERHDGDRRRRRVTTASLGALGVGGLALAVGLGAPGAGGATPTMAAPTASAPAGPRSEESPAPVPEPWPAVEPGAGPVTAVAAETLLPQAAAAMDASPDAISQVTIRTRSYSDDVLDSVLELRSTVAADGSWTLNERLRDDQSVDGPPVLDTPRDPHAPVIGAWGTYLQPDGSWTSIAVDRNVGIWSTETSATDPNPTVSTTIIGADGVETVVESPTNAALSAARSFRSTVDVVLRGEYGYAVVEGSEEVQDVEGVTVVCVDYVVDDSVSPTEFDRHGQLCVDPVSGLPRKLVDVYSKGGPGRPDGYSSDEVSTFSDERVFGWYASTSENERLFDISLDGLAKVSPEALQSQTSLFPTY